MTPAQASGHPNFVTDVPVQGPTDEGIRAADCWQAQHVLPARPACADCKGPIPMWAQTSLSHVRGQSAGVGIGERLSFNGFSLSAAGDPEIWTQLSAAQQKWVMDTLVKLNNIIVSKTGATCATFGPSVTAAGGCFQAWWNASGISPQMIRTDGVFDEETLCALITMAGIHSADFPTMFPDPEGRYCQIPTTMAPQALAPVEPEKKKLSTAAVVGIGAAVIAVGGGAVYLATRKTKKKSRKARRRR